MSYRETQSLVHKLMSSAQLASSYVNKMIERESRGWGDTTNAMKRLNRRYGLSFWTLNNLRIGRSKTVDASLFNRIKSAYLDVCERQIANLQHELTLEKMGTPDAPMEDFEREAAELLAKVREAKKAAE